MDTTFVPSSEALIERRGERRMKIEMSTVISRQGGGEGSECHGRVENLGITGAMLLVETGGLVVEGEEVEVSVGGMLAVSAWVVRQEESRLAVRFEQREGAIVEAFIQSLLGPVY